MAFGDVLRRNMHQLSSASRNKLAADAFWVILRDIAVQDILGVYPSRVDSDIAVEVYYNILRDNVAFIPTYFREIIKSNKQERFRVINRNVWTSNAFHPEGLANQDQIVAYKEINSERKGEKIVYQGVR